MQYEARNIILSPKNEKIKIRGKRKIKGHSDSKGPQYFCLPFGRIFKTDLFPQSVPGDISKERTFDKQCEFFIFTVCSSSNYNRQPQSRSVTEATHPPRAFFL